jgi:tRNA threonylcarbamoyl adenosine modification protein (Sua5/YciO/YrdC/YwlC family)
MTKRIRIYEENPQPRLLQEAADVLANGGVIIIPTDTIYSFAADISKPKALEKMARLKNLKMEKADFSFIFYDLSHLSDYTRQIDTPTYKLLKRTLPGSFTFILEANNTIPKIFKSKKKTIGIRVPDRNITRELVKLLGHPIATSSIHDDDEIIEYTTDPDLIFERYDGQVDLMIDAGYGDNFASTVVDLTSGVPEILREGKGPISLL